MKKPASSKTAARGPSASTPRSGAAALDRDLIEALASIAARHDLTELELEHAGLHIRVARQSASAPSASPVSVIMPPPAASSSALNLPAPAPAAPEDHPGAVKSPMVGTVYRRPSPDSKPFVEIGSVVKAGEKVLLIEAMKTFNEIVAPRDGVVASILIEDGQPVEYGEALIVIA